MIKDWPLITLEIYKSTSENDQRRNYTISPSYCLSLFAFFQSTGISMFLPEYMRVYLPVFSSYSQSFYDSALPSVYFNVACWPWSSNICQICLQTNQHVIYVLTEEKQLPQTFYFPGSCHRWLIYWQRRSPRAKMLFILLKSYFCTHAFMGNSL